MSPETPETPEATVRELLGTALGAPLGAGEDPHRGEREDWNSLIHIELVFMLEERFGVRFSDAEIVALNSPAEIVALLESKHGG